MNRISLLSLLFVFGLFGCSSDDESKTEPKEPSTTEPVVAKNDEVNDFIWNAMNSWYYWQNEIPDLADDRFSNKEKYTNFINANDDHEDFFYNLLYQYGEVDRFSWIVDDVDELLASFSGKQAATGINFGLGLLRDERSVIGVINYVIPESSAAKAGLKRGDVFIKIDGEPLSIYNYKSKVFKENFTITIAENYDASNYTWDSEKTYTINGGELQENPIHHYEVLEEGNHKIGYLVMNAFRSNYNDELNEVFAQFKAKNVTDLIIDFRYNGGGALNTAMALGQMITGQFTGKKYVSLEYNDKHKSDNRYRFFEKNVHIYKFEDGDTEYERSEPVNSLNLNKVYFLTSGSTASASELTISSLKPYIDVVQIGDTTYGKFVGSITLVDDSKSDFTNHDDRSKKHNYGLQPIVFAYYNSNKEIFTEGLAPNKYINSFDYIGEIKEFGNPSDPALAEALTEITGNSYKKHQSKKNKNKIRFLESSVTLDRFGTELYMNDYSERE